MGTWKTCIKDIPSRLRQSRGTSLAAAWVILAALSTTPAVARAISAVLHAQATAGAVQGRILDETKGVLPGVEVTLEQRPGGQSRKTFSDDFGLFEFRKVKPGRYILKAELAGFQSYRKEFTLAAGETVLIDATLKIGMINEMVAVIGQPGRIQTSQATVGGMGRASRNLPLNARSAHRLARLSSADVQVRRSPTEQGGNTEAYDHIKENEFIRVVDDPRSTFSIDVDTASYSNVRRFLSRQDQLPPPDAVRIEELINYFRYDHPEPEGDFPFQVTLETASAPWKPSHRLVSIGIKGRTIDFSARPPGNFVFLVDVSGSMSSPDKLPLLKQGLAFLVQQLGPQDRIAMVVYAGSSGLALGSTPCTRKAEIMAALDNLESGGSTNGGAGIKLAYQVASDNFIEGGTNRVVLATDGDFNVGVTSKGDLIRLIEKEAQKGVFLTVLGFGTGNLKDSTMEKLADRGNGNYAYVDSLHEARKVLVEEIGSNLITIAKDVKIQVEFNPQEVESFRLLGYENRLLAHQDFNDDRKDAGEIGAGHSLTVLYEVVPAGVQAASNKTDPLRYQLAADLAGEAFSGELLLLRMRYKDPDSEQSRLIEAPVRDDGTPFSAASEDLRFAASVASFGMLLRDSDHAGGLTYEDVLDWARDSLGRDVGGYRQEFLELVQTARELAAPVAADSGG